MRQMKVVDPDQFQLNHLSFHEIKELAFHGSNSTRPLPRHANHDHSVVFGFSLQDIRAKRW
jgi:hypothetical protein